MGRYIKSVTGILLKVNVVMFLLLKGMAIANVDC